MRLKEVCIDLPILRGMKISLIQRGYNRDIFLLQNGDTKYIAHVKPTNRVVENSLEKEAAVLAFLGEQNITFVPTLIHFDKENEVLVSSYVASGHVDFETKNQHLVALFIKQLVMLHTIPHSIVKAFYIKNKALLPRPLSPSVSLRTYGAKRFEVIKKTCPDKKIVTYLEERLLQIKNSLPKTQRKQYHFLWFDLGDKASNVLVENDSLFFIDFEFACVGYSSELAWMKIHGGLKKSTFKRMVTEYSKLSKISEIFLYQEVCTEEKITRLLDVIWAAMKWGEHVGTEEEQKYKDLTMKRKILFEKCLKETS